MWEGIYQAWGANVRREREALGLSQEDLAQRVDSTQASISRIEVGEQAPRDGMKARLAVALGKSLDELFPWPEAVAS